VVWPIWPLSFFHGQLKVERIQLKKKVKDIMHPEQFRTVFLVFGGQINVIFPERNQNFHFKIHVPFK
jgi:hypothetical protein